MLDVGLFGTIPLSQDRRRHDDRSRDIPRRDAKEPLDDKKREQDRQARASSVHAGSVHVRTLKGGIGTRHYAHPWDCSR
eukprot:475447-Amphidinium_carterae.1